MLLALAACNDLLALAAGNPSSDALPLLQAGSADICVIYIYVIYIYICVCDIYNIYDIYIYIDIYIYDRYIYVYICDI